MAGLVLLRAGVAGVFIVQDQVVGVAYLVAGAVAWHWRPERLVNTGANPFHARLDAILGSDIGHFDVPDMMEVIPEAYEQVEDSVITSDDFRDFTFTNAVRLWGTQNPRFFEGTAVAKAAAAVLAQKI